MRRATGNESTRQSRGRPAKRALPAPIPDMPENFARVSLTTPPKREDEWRYLTEPGDD